MRIIGITGGIGSGKTEVLSYIREKYNCGIILADEVAHRVQETGQPCYFELLRLLGRDILSENGQIDKNRMAAKIFADAELLRKTNAIIHPAVKEYILSAIKNFREEKRKDFLFIEAALLIEDGYEEIVDELWYIHSGQRVRRERLKRWRNYDDEKIDSILKSQLSEEEYKRRCRVTVDNSGALQDTYEQIDRKLEEYL